MSIFVLQKAFSGLRAPFPGAVRFFPKKTFGKFGELFWKTSFLMFPDFEPYAYPFEHFQHCNTLFQP